ncbi:MAG: hypothetical protein N2Z22_01680 [Turneriella sp.]|nr:hypothetical protein [Turneriella sp.]
MLRKSIIACLLAATLAGAQDSKEEKKETVDQAGTAKQHPVGWIRDERIAVENLSFWKRNASDGKGDYLELSFDIINKTEDPIPLKMFLIAFNEQDLVDHEYRRYVEYPKWRVWDEDKIRHKLILFDSLPAMDHKAVAAYARKREEAVAKTGGFKPREEPEQPVSKRRPTLKQFLDYVMYVHENPNTGIELLLQSYDNANHNLRCGSENKDGKKCFEKRGNYLIEEKALKTSVWARLLAPYTTDKKFFNHFGLVLYDTEAKKIVHRQFYSIKGRFKLY